MSNDTSYIILRNRIISKYFITHNIYIKLASFWRSRKTSPLYRDIQKNGLSIISPFELKRRVLLRCLNPAETICHIIGSGWSLNKSQGLINQDDFVIGFNQAGVSGLNFDLYFVEFGGEKVDEIAKKQIELVDNVIRQQTDLIIFKNLSEQKNNINYVIKNWGNRVYYIKDYLVPCLDIKRLNQTIKFVLKPDSNFLRQFKASLISCVICAKYIGFKTIILHGVDFGGDYFFDESNFKGLKKYRPRVNKNSRFYAKLKTNDLHPTAKGEIKLQDTIPIIKKELNKKNILLYSSIPISPLSNYLPSYYSEIRLC